MNIKKLSLAAAVSALTFATASNAVLGPIPIYLNTEYRTDAPVIGSIASTLSFDANDIKATGANTFLDFLATVPSVGLVDAQGNIPAVFIRGGNSEHTLFIVDGVSVNDISSPNGAISNGLSTIALNDIEKVEIIKGSGSVLYGSSAVAGVIAITTKKGAEGEHATVSTKFGTHNSKTYTLSASSGGKDNFVRFTHNKYTTDGINAKVIDDTDEKDGINNLSTQIKIGNENYAIGYLESRNKSEYDGYSSDSGELSDQELTKLTANVSKQISETWNTKLSLSQIKRHRNSGANAIILGDKFKSTDMTILNDIKIDNALLSVGLSKIDDENTTLSQKLTSKNLFVNWQKNIDSVDISTGIRYIKHSNFDNKTIYNLGATKYLNSGIKLTSTYGTAFRVPTLTELNGRNPDLKPETSKNIELGVEKQHAWGLSSIKVYKNNMKNRIAYDGIWDDAPAINYFNSGESDTKGIELSVNANINGYNTDFSHDYNKSEATNNGETVKGQTSRRAKNTTSLTISKQYGQFSSRIQINKKSSTLDDTTFDGLGDLELKGYTLLNLSTNYTINNNANISLNVKNATDKVYTIVNGYNQLGRTVELGLEYKF